MRGMHAAAVLGVFLIPLTPGVGAGATREIPLTGVQAIRRADGEGRVLFRAPQLVELSGKSVTHAVVEIPLSGAAAPRDVDVYLFAVSREWTDGAVSWMTPWRVAGGEWSLDDYGLVHLRAGETRRALRFDVTTLVRAITRGEAPAHGFILTAGPAEGVGRLRPGDLALLGSLSGAKLEVSYHGRRRPHP